MLEILWYNERCQAEAYLRQLDLAQSSLIVSDLSSKIDFQNKILDQQGFFLDGHVLRASDIWKTMARKILPDYKILSESFFKLKLRLALKELQSQAGLESLSEKTLREYLNFFLGILIRPDLTEKIIEWAKGEESLPEWYPWFLQTQFCFTQLVKNEKVIVASWVPLFLEQTFQESFDNINLQKAWPILPEYQAKVVFDLRGQLRSSEVQLIKKMAETFSVVILAPNFKDESPFWAVREAYEAFQDSSGKHLPQTPKNISGQIIAKKYSGTQAELFACVRQVRMWLEAGMDLKNISVSAADIETHWPLLQSLFQIEGIPVQKKLMARLNSFPLVTKWISNLRIKISKFEWTDIESHFFLTEENPTYPFQRLQSLFKNIFSENDIERLASWSVQMKKNQVSGLLFRDEWLLLIAQEWKDPETANLERLLKEMIANAEPDVRLKTSDWLFYTETLCAGLEIEVQKETVNGLCVESFSAGSHYRKTHRIYFGLTEEALTQKSKKSIVRRDLIELKKATGLLFEDPELSLPLLDLTLGLSADFEQCVLTTALADIRGELTNPAALWLRQKSGFVETQGVDGLVWQSLQSHSPDVQICDDRLLRPQEEVKMSASLLQQFLMCPFKFKAVSLYKLGSDPVLDLDVDVRTLGSLAHSLFEILVKDLNRTWTLADCKEHLLKTIEENQIYFVSEKMKNAILGELSSFGMSLFTFEKARILERSLSPIAFEKKFSFEWPQIFNGIRFKVSGVIDRIDQTASGSVYLIDYKRTDSQSPWKKWIENREPQMPLYLWVIRQSLISDIPSEVVGALYLKYTQLSLKGVIVSESESEIATLHTNYKTSRIELDALAEQFKNQIESAFKQISEGGLEAIPHDPQDCQKCDWNKLCRSPHLSL